MEVVKPTRDGGVARVEGKHTSYWVKSSILYDVLEGLEHWKPRPIDSTKKFPWYHRSFGWDKDHATRSPTPRDCFQPKAALESLQWLERELQRNSHRYPMEWTFHVPQPDGSVKKSGGFTAFYRNKPCRLFGDAQGCWAAETDTPLTYPVHYELTAQPDVVVRFERDGPDVRVAISSRSHLAVHTPMIQELKFVCLEAMRQNALLLTTIG